MISVQNISMRYGSKVLFEDVTTTFSKGRRYGLTGPNGSGKSTFMKLLTGDLTPQKGSVVAPDKLGVLRQDQFAFDQFRVIDTVVMGNRRLWDALQARDVLYAKTDLTDEDGMRLGELEGIVGEEDGYSAESDAAILLQGLDIPAELHERTMAELQGGQKVRVLLAQALFGRPEALLLDEPTNHLDLDSIHWLREFLVRYEGTLIVISHDRHFLNEVCTHTADIDYQTIITYTGGYDEMVLAKMQIRATVESQNAQREKKIAQLNDFIARFSAGTRSSQVQSRRKEVERLQTTELARSNIQRPYIKFSMQRPSGKLAFECSGVSKSHGDLSVIDGFDAVVGRGEKIVLVGRNGLGKTTMLKALLADAPGRRTAPGDIDEGVDPVGPRGVDRLLPAGPHGRHRARDDGRRMAAPVRSRRVAAGDSRPARPDALQRRGGPQTDARAVRRRNGAAAVLPDDAAEAERPRSGRADEPPRPRVHQRPERRAPEIRRDGTPRHPRPGSDGGSRHEGVALRRRPHHRLQGHVRGVRGGDGVSDSPGARVTVSRTSKTDIGQRQVIVSVDDGPRKTLLFGESATFDIAPGDHALKSNNTLIWKTVPFSAASGEHVHFEIANRATRFTLGFLSLIGVAPLYLTIERKDERKVM